MALITDHFYIPDVFKDARVEIIEWRHADLDSLPAEPGAEVLRVRVWPPTIHRSLPDVGYVSPTPSFQDDLPGGGSAQLPVFMALRFIAIQVKTVVEDFQDLFYNPEIFAKRHPK